MAQINRDRVEQFGERLLEGLNNAALMLMVSLGHRSGLFDTMAGLPPATSAEIAGAAGLSERYVREWLGAMVTGRIVEHDPEGGRFRLPPEHAASLTREAGSGNMAPFAQYIAVLGAAEDDVLAAFTHGRGVPYERYARFHEVMAEDSNQSVVSALEGQILALDPALRRALEGGVDVLDVGCGAGRALNKLARLFPRSRFLGYDLSPEAVATARAQARELDLANVVFEVRDCTDLGEESRFDVIFTFDAVHDQGRPDLLLAGIRRALRPGGLYLMQDIKGRSHLHDNIDHPLGPFLYTISCMHCMSVSLAQEGGMGLGAMWGRETATRMLAEAGFDRVELRELEHDPQNDYYLCRSSRSAPAVAEARTS
jgi:SAM-dependent methyltransferase